MSSNQVEIKFMIAKLYDWNQQLGGSEAKRSLATSEFQFLQEEFLTKRHQVDRLQQQKQTEGLTTKNASISFQIRQGLESLREILSKLRQEQKRSAKKKKDSVEMNERREKIVKNCQLLLQDLEEREETNGPQYKHKATTLTDMKAKLLEEIQLNADQIHVQKTFSDERLSENNSEDEKVIKGLKHKDQQMDIVLDEIITNVKGVREKVKQINSKQDQIHEKVQKGNQKAGELEKRIKKDNDKLKVIIEKFKPSRCCLGIALFLLFVGLIVCIVKLLI